MIDGRSFDNNRIQSYCSKLVPVLLSIWLLIIIFQDSTYKLLPEIAKVMPIVSAVSYLVRIVLFGCCILSVSLTDRKRLIRIGVFLVVSVVSFYFSGVPTFFNIFMLAATADCICERELQKTFLGSIVVGTTIVIASSIFGIIPNAGIGTPALGFEVRSEAGFFLMTIGLLCMLLLHERYQILVIGVSICLAGVCFLISSKTPFLILSLETVLLFVMHVRKSCQISRVCKAAYIVPVVMAIISHVLIFTRGRYPLNFDMPYQFFSFVNRFRHAYFGFSYYGVGLFGIKESFPTSYEYAVSVGFDEAITFDNLYAALPLKYGIVMSVYFAYMYFRAVKFAADKHDYLKLLVLIIVSIYSFMENYLLFVPLCFVFICGLKANDGNKLQEASA